MINSLMKNVNVIVSWMMTKSGGIAINVRATILALPLFPTVHKIYWHLIRVLKSAHVRLTFISRDVCLYFHTLCTGIHGGPVLSEWKL